MREHLVLWLDPYVWEWGDLLFRFLHVVAAIAWIGGSFYYIALDYHLRPPANPEDAERGVGGEAWEIHGGGFYRVEKFTVAPKTLPSPLHWFKWEAYTTWLSGFALFVVFYYVHASTYLVDPSVADIPTWAAILISIGGLVVAWLVYDGLCRVLGEREWLLAAAVFAFVCLSAWAACSLFSGRAAYVQVGAMLGTIMAANVFLVIIPAHWELIRAKEAGREPDPKWNFRGKQRSVHNNYLTLPVVFAMLSNHFPFTYGHSHAWLILVALMAIGAWIRHFFNLHHQGRDHWWILVTAGAALVVVAVLIRPRDNVSQGATAETVPFVRVQAIVKARCLPCHSQNPTEAGFESAPAGVRFDTRGEIESRAAQIKQQAVDTKAMPLGNATGMTQAERDLLARWLASR
jgi:uncharacterized membrane protein